MGQVMQPGSCSLRVILAFDGNTNSRSPFGPRTIVIAHAFKTEQVGQDEPRVGGTFPDPAVRDFGAAAIQSEVLDGDLFEFVAGLKASVFMRGPAPRHLLRGRHILRASRYLFGRVRRGSARAGDDE